MNEPMLISLQAAGRHEWSRVGGKAAHLGELLAAGFPVPAGLCITTDAFQLALTDHQAAIQGILEGSDCRQPEMAQSAA